MNELTRTQLKEILRYIRDCENYLEGRQSSKFVEEMVAAAAKRAVLERIANLEDRLRNAGLNIKEEV